MCNKKSYINLLTERFIAEDVTTIGENLYEIKLTIDPIKEVNIS